MSRQTYNILVSGRSIKLFLCHSECANTFDHNVLICGSVLYFSFAYVQAHIQHSIDRALNVNRILKALCAILLRCKHHQACTPAAPRMKPLISSSQEKHLTPAGEMPLSLLVRYTAMYTANYLYVLFKKKVVAYVGRTEHSIRTTQRRAPLTEKKGKKSDDVEWIRSPKIQFLRTRTDANTFSPKMVIYTKLISFFNHF